MVCVGKHAVLCDNVCTSCSGYWVNLCSTLIAIPLLYACVRASDMFLCIVTIIPQLHVKPQADVQIKYNTYKSFCSVHCMDLIYQKKIFHFSWPLSTVVLNSRDYQGLRFSTKHQKVHTERFQKGATTIHVSLNDREIQLSERWYPKTLHPQNLKIQKCHILAHFTSGMSPEKFITF